MNFYNFLEQLTDKHKLAYNPNDYLDDYTRADITDFDHLCDELGDNGFFDIEIIYYRKAINYLRENDPSLSDSLNLAHDMGYTITDVNAATLAGLLAREKFADDFYRLEEEINEFLNQ